MLTATELARVENDKMERAIRYEKLLNLVTSGKADVKNLKARLKRFDEAITKATKVEDAAAFLEKDIPGVGGRDCRVVILESTAMYRLFHTQQRKIATELLAKAEGDLERCELELAELTS